MPSAVSSAGTQCPLLLRVLGQHGRGQGCFSTSPKSNSGGFGRTIGLATGGDAVSTSFLSLSLSLSLCRCLCLSRYRWGPAPTAGTGSTLAYPCGQRDLRETRLRESRSPCPSFLLLQPHPTFQSSDAAAPMVPPFNLTSDSDGSCAQLRPASGANYPTYKVLVMTVREKGGACKQDPETLFPPQSNSQIRIPLSSLSAGKL